MHYLGQEKCMPTWNHSKNGIGRYVRIVVLKSFFLMTSLLLVPLGIFFAKIQANVFDLLFVPLVPTVIHSLLSVNDSQLSV